MLLSLTLARGASVMFRSFEPYAHLHVPAHVIVDLNGSLTASQRGQHPAYWLKGVVMGVLTGVSVSGGLNSFWPCRKSTQIVRRHGKPLDSPASTLCGAAPCLHWIPLQRTQPVLRCQAAQAVMRGADRSPIVTCVLQTLCSMSGNAHCCCVVPAPGAGCRSRPHRQRGGPA